MLFTTGFATIDPTNKLMRHCLTQSFRQEMKEALDKQECPLDANLEKVIPGLHQWHKENNSIINSLDKKITEGLGGLQKQMNDGFQEVVEQLQQQSSSSSDRMADMFLEMALKLKAGDVDLTSFRTRPPEQSGTSESSRPNCLGNSRGDVGGSSGDVLTGESATEVSSEHWDHVDHTSFTLTIKHSTLRNMHAEWFGTDPYQDKYGGVEGREVLFGKDKAKWRRHLDNQHFSHTKRLVHAIVEYAKANKITAE